MIGDLVGAPLVGRVGDLDPARGGRVDVDDVDAGAVAGDDAAAPEGLDRPSADARVLRDDGVGVAPLVDDLVLALALRRYQREPGLLDDRALHVDVAEVLVGNEDGLFLAHGRLPFAVDQWECRGSPRRCTRS